jgi:hypothetical protein
VCVGRQLVPPVGVGECGRNPLKNVRLLPPTGYTAVGALLRCPLPLDLLHSLLVVSPSFPIRRVGTPHHIGAVDTKVRCQRYSHPCHLNEHPAVAQSDDSIGLATMSSLLEDAALHFDFPSVFEIKADRRFCGVLPLSITRIAQQPLCLLRPARSSRVSERAKHEWMNGWSHCGRTAAYSTALPHPRYVRSSRQPTAPPSPSVVPGTTRPWWNGLGGSS